MPTTPAAASPRPLPTWPEAAHACNGGSDNPLFTFIYHHEPHPAQSAEWRAKLLEALEWYAEHRDRLPWLIGKEKISDEHRSGLDG